MMTDEDRKSLKAINGPGTLKKMTNKRGFAFHRCNEIWHKLTNEEKEFWRNKAKNMHASGFNLFLKDCRKKQEKRYENDFK